MEVSVQLPTHPSLTNRLGLESRLEIGNDGFWSTTHPPLPYILVRVGVKAGDR